MEREPIPPERREQYRREFAEYANLAYFIAIRNKLCEDGSAPPDHDNAIGNAIGVAWKHYPRLREKFPERPPRQVVVMATRRGVSRVKRGEQLGRELPYPGYRDALGKRPQALPQLRLVPVDTLAELFGSSGRHYWELAHGLDMRPVVPDREAKSISHETTFAVDIADQELLRAWLVELVEQVARRLRQHDIQGRSVELKVRFADFRTISRSLTLPRPTSITQELLDAGIELLTKRLPPRHLPVRLLGFGVHRFADSGLVQQQLFDQPERERHLELDRVADQITAKFGQSALRRGTGLGKDPDPT